MLKFDGSEETFYTIPETVDMLHSSVPTVYRMFKRGELRKVKLGGKAFVRASDVNALIQSLTDDPTPINQNLRKSS